MAHTFKISTFGLTLIMAYEGFRQVETTLVSGQRVIGYGHRYKDSEEPTISRKQAENLLKDDLEAYADLINENVHAPLTQSQFDALVSLSFNIGPKEFLASDVFHSLNNGRPLEAASGFDQWRKSVIGGKTYIVDALVRRRTAEKALFLRAADGVVSAPRLELPPKQDHEVSALDADVSVFDKTNVENLVPQAPYSAQKENVDKAVVEAVIDTVPETTAPVPKSQAKDEPVIAEPMTAELSPIAIAAEEVSEQLDRLIADNPNGEAHISVSPLAPPSEEQNSPVGLDWRAQENKTDNARAANEGTRDDYRRPRNGNASSVRTPDAFIQQGYSEAAVDEKPPSLIAYWISMIIGASLLGGGLVKWFLKPDTNPDQYSQFIAPAATVIGAMIVIGSLYYLIKTFKRRSDMDY